MGSCSHETIDAPIVLGNDDGSDTELDASLSSTNTPDEDDDRTLRAAPIPPPDANGHDSPTSVPAVPAKPIANGQA